MELELEQFITYLREVKKSSNNTVVSYRRDLTKLNQYLQNQGIQSYEQVNETSLNSYILYLEKEGMAASTVSRNIAAMKAFMLFLLKNQFVTNDPTERIKSPKIDKKMPEILTIEQVNRLLELPATDNKKGMRDKAMLELLYATGIRVSELIGLKLQDVNLRSNYIICRSDVKERIIPFGVIAKKALSDYMNNAREELICELSTEYLFTNRSGQPMSRQGFWKLLKKYAKEVGIDGELTPRMLRHSFAAHLIAGGADIKAVQEMLGYSDISTAQIYMCTSNRKVRDVYVSTHPRA
ncbi:site-specific tyrosine recombinase XerD [Anaeromicropila herbilytica]|uniref:Tyrosine recombinase XerD n=1 Tax=Anaeromicropila herbilytica TaxID=2785025 RepID=A0A7R7EM45_9FIRM|nr:site-specific tyrosine recombinase XerD [Anaeromicropila herbilytica]BCN31406.1 tyrosine recombinase XerD [Anaeromicropila herbilytica]